MRLFAALGLLLLTATGCIEVGDGCEVTGDGFTRRDPCASAWGPGVCLAWEVTCPDGRRFTPNECAGKLCGDGQACPDGQMCMQIDAFPQNSRCVAANICE